MKTAKLKQIAEIQTGYPFRGRIKPKEKGKYRVVQGRDVDNHGRLVDSELTSINLDNPSPRYFVSKEDVLFLAKSNRNIAAPVIKEVPNTVAANSYFIVKLKSDEIEPGYLAWYINQTKAQVYLANNRRGVHMPMVGRKEFEELEVEIPPLSLQNTILNLAFLASEENRLLDLIKIKRQQLIQAQCNKALQNAK